MESRVRLKFLLWAAEKKLKNGSRIDPQAFFQNFYSRLDPPEQAVVTSVLRSLQREGLLNFDPPWTNYNGVNEWVKNVARYSITADGQDAVYSEKYRAEETSMKRSAIGTIHIGPNSNVQVGDGNTIKTENFFRDLEMMIERSDSNNEEKAKAKSLLIKVSENPLLSKLLSSLGGVAMRQLLGLP